MNEIFVLVDLMDRLKGAEDNQTDTAIENRDIEAKLDRINKDIDTFSQRGGTLSQTQCFVCKFH